MISFICALGHSLSVLPGLKMILNAYDLPLVERIRDGLGDFPELTSRIFARTERRFEILHTGHRCRHFILRWADNGVFLPDVFRSRRG